MPSRRKMQSISMFGEMIVNDILSEGPSVSKEKLDELERIVESSLRQLHGHRTQDTDEEINPIITTAAEIYFDLLEGAEILLFGIVPPTMHLELSFNLKAFFGLHESELVQMAIRKMQRITSPPLNTHNVAKTFCHLIQLSLKLAQSR